MWEKDRVKGLNGGGGPLSHCHCGVYEEGEVIYRGPLMVPHTYHADREALEASLDQ